MKKELSVIESINNNDIKSKIFTIRSKQIMFDKDLAELYGVSTKRVNEAVRRNKDRFPNGFMFQLTSNEFANLRSQFATSSWGGNQAKRMKKMSRRPLLLCVTLNLFQDLPLIFFTTRS